MAALLIALLISSAPGATLDRIVAIVDDEVIALSEIYELGGEYIDTRCVNEEASCIAEMELEVLDVLIKRLLVRHELNRLEMRVSGQEIDQAIDRFARENEYDDRLGLRKALEEEGTRWDAFREEMGDRMRTQRFQQRILLPRVTVSDDEVRDLYQRTARKTISEEVLLNALGVVIPTGTTDELRSEMRTQTDTLVTAINAGEVTWDDAVEKYDGADLARVVGGRRYRRGQLADILEEAAFSAEVGVAQPPIEMNEMFFVIMVAERGEGEARLAEFEEVEDQLRDQVFQEKVTAAEEEWYQMARRQISVEVLFEP